MVTAYSEGRVQETLQRVGEFSIQHAVAGLISDVKLCKLSRTDTRMLSTKIILVSVVHEDGEVAELSFVHRKFRTVGRWASAVRGS